MKYLKFSLFGIVLCAMVFSTGYSTNNNFNQFSNQNINNIYFGDYCDEEYMVHKDKEKHINY